MAELTIALSLATDLATGQPMEHGLRTCHLALRVADAMGVDAPGRSAIYYVALLRFMGCTSEAANTAELAGGDDLNFNAVMAPMLNAGGAEAMRHFVFHLAEELPLHRRAGRVLKGMTDPAGAARTLSGHCEVAERLASRLSMSDMVRAALGHAYERWDGKGFPSGLAGDDVPFAVRVVTVARDVEMWSRAGGWPAVVDVLRRRRDRAYDPAVVDAFLATGEEGLTALDDSADDLAAVVLAAEPAPALTIEADDLGSALTAVAEFADMKSPFFRTHSTGVADLARAAAYAAGLGESDAVQVWQAGLVHDVGRVVVPNGIWDRSRGLTPEQWERVRLHPYYGDRILRRCGALAPLADLAACHHERHDGSGYHRGLAGDDFPLAARLLAVADAYHAMREDRPHRPALSDAEATAELRAAVERRAFGPAEVEAVLQAAGVERERGRPLEVARPAGLTEREVDVLRLIARGLSNKAVAVQLSISPKTVGHHIEHIYVKAGVSTRAGATLFAMENGLLTR